MSVNEMKNILRVALMEYRKWIISNRMIVAAAFLIFIWNFAVYSLTELSTEMNSPLNVCEPYIAVCNSRVLCMLTPAIFLFLVADCPQLDHNSLFILHRTSRNKWIIGEFIFFILAAVTFGTIIALGSVIPNAYHAFAANGWSLVVTRYGVYFPDKASSFAAGLIPKSLYHQIPPFQAALLSFLFTTLYMILLAEILLMATVHNKKHIGLMISVAIIAVGAALGFMDANGMWIFPMAHSVVSLHYTDYFQEPVCSFQFSLLYDLIAIVVCFIVSLVAVKKTAFYDIKDTD